MPRYLIQRRRRWYAILEVPKKLREHFGRERFKKSLETESLSEAEVRVLPIIAGWKRDIEDARSGKSQAEHNTWLEWKEDYRSSKGEEREILDSVLDEMIEQSFYSKNNNVDSLLKVVKGNSVPIGNYIDEWINTLSDEPKTKDMKRADVVDFSIVFAFNHQVTRQEVRKWALGLLHGGDESKRLARKTVQRKLSFIGRYFGYLQAAGHVEGDEEPFRGVIETAKKDRTKAGARRGWVALTDREVVSALDCAMEKGDHSLAALIWLAMWTGCRIEELCSLKVSMVSEDRITIVDSKTNAGNREVPLHSIITKTVNILKNSSYNGYIISGLTSNKYGDRSNAVGKRFGRLVQQLKMGDRKVFHSIRKTVVTQLENSAVPSGFVADIVGHEKASFTFGVYSAGALFERKREAIERLSYPLKRNYDFMQAKPSRLRRQSLLGPSGGKPPQ